MAPLDESWNMTSTTRGEDPGRNCMLNMQIIPLIYDFCSWPQHWCCQTWSSPSVAPLEWVKQMPRQRKTNFQPLAPVAANCLLRFAEPCCLQSLQLFDRPIGIARADLQLTICFLFALLPTHPRCHKPDASSKRRSPAGRLINNYSSCTHQGSCSSWYRDITPVHFPFFSPTPRTGELYKIEG